MQFLTKHLSNLENSTLHTHREMPASESEEGKKSFEKRIQFWWWIKLSVFLLLIFFFPPSQQFFLFFRQHLYNDNLSVKFNYDEICVSIIITCESHYAFKYLTTNFYPSPPSPFLFLHIMFAFLHQCRPLKERKKKNFPLYEEKKKKEKKFLCGETRDKRKFFFGLWIFARAKSSIKISERAAGGEEE